jgi:cell division protein FtsQ
VLSGSKTIQVKRNSRRRDVRGWSKSGVAGARRAAIWCGRIAWRGWPAFLFLALLGLIWYRLHHAEYFRLAEIEVSPTEHVAKSDFLAFLHARRGQTIFSLDLNDTADRVISHPWIKGAVVRRQLPDTLVVEIAERHAVALLQMERLYLVDEDGVAFKQLDEGDPRDLPLLTGFTKEAFQNGDQTARRSAVKVREAVQLLLLGERLQVFTEADISEIRYDPVGGFSLVTTEKGMVVHFGYGDYEKKLKLLAAVTDRLNGRLQAEARVVDLGVGDRVVVRGLRKGSNA